MNGKFIEKYGEAWTNLDNDTRQMVLMSEIFDLREDVAENRKVVLDNFNEFKIRCEGIDTNRDILQRHVTYWKLSIALGSILIATIIGYIVPKLMGLF